MLVTQSCPALCDPVDCSPPRLLCPWHSPGKNTGMGKHSLLQGISLIQGPKPGFLHCMWTKALTGVFAGNAGRVSRLVLASSDDFIESSGQVLSLFVWYLIPGG